MVSPLISSVDCSGSCVWGELPTLGPPALSLLPVGQEAAAQLITMPV